MTTQANKLISQTQYLSIERRSAWKSEYFNGQMYAMAGASQKHNLIVSNIIRALSTQLLTSPCNVYPGDMRVKVATIGKYTYPALVFVSAT